MDEDKSPSFYAEEMTDDEMALIEHAPISVSPVALRTELSEELTSSGSFNLKKIGNAILDKLLEVLPFATVLVDHSGCIVFMNMAAAGLSGASFASLFSFPQDAQRAEALLASVWTARSPLTAEAMVQICEKKFWARMHLRSIRLRNQRLVLALFEDLTAEKSRESLNEKYRKLVQMFPMGIAEFRLIQELNCRVPLKDLMHSVAEALLVGGNLEFARMHGYSDISTAKGLPFRTFAAFLDDCEDQIAEWVAEGFGRGRVRNCEITSEGEKKSFENTLVGDLKDGRLVGFWFVRRDTTVEEFKDEDLRKNEQFALKIFEENSLGMAVSSHDGRIQKVNQTLCSMLEYSERDVISKSFASITHPDDRKKPFDLKKMLDGTHVTPCRFESRLRTKSKSSVSVNITGFVIKDHDGQSDQSIIMVENVTDQKKAREFVNLLTAAVQQSSEGICVTDLTGRVIFVNQAFARLHQYSADELIGKHQSFFHPASDMLSLVAAKRRLMQTGEFSGEMRHLRGDGHIFPGLLHSTLIHDESGNPAAVLNAIRDISEIKTTEQALRASSEKLTEYSHYLEAKVGERTRILEETKKQIEMYEAQLKKAEEALKILIAGVEDQKKTAENKILDNVRSTLKPIMNRLKTEDLSKRVREVVDLLDGTLENVGPSPAQTITEKRHLLTLRELRICELINTGLTSKEVAKILGVSPHTVFLHRANIRKKLGLTGNEDDLASYLSTPSKKKV